MAKKNLSDPQAVEAYIAGFPLEVRERLNQVRALIRELAPQAQERLGYGMPGYYLAGPLVYFGAFKDHLGLYPTGEGMKIPGVDLSGYKTSKGAVQFPHDRELPLDLIRTLVLARLNQVENP